MKRKEISTDSITDAREEIVLKYLRNTDRRYDRGRENIIYFDGWNGLGASAVLAAIAESVRTDGPKFDIVIHVDCSVWESRREMQRKIAEELKLDRSVMVLFDKQDEEDDFSGLDKGSRAEIDDVAELIFQAAEDRRCLIIFHNGSDNEIDLSTSGVPVFDSKNKVLWTFRGRFRLDPTITEKVQSADIFLSACPTANIWFHNDLSAVVHEEAAQVSHDISPTVITDCWLYLSLLHYNHDNSSDYDGDSHASNYWVCDGIISGDSAWKIADRLHEEMRMEYLPTKQDHGKWFEKLCGLHEKKSRWISITSKNVEIQNIQTIPKETTSCFLTLEKSDPPTALPKHLFEQSSKLRVLRLSWCTFSFACPPFMHCSSLRFVFIDSCRDEDVEFTGKGDDKQDTEWTFLQRLWVLDIRCTSWDWILSPAKMMLMSELRELNLTDAGASRSDWDMKTLELTWLRDLQRLRVINSSTFLTAVVQNSFMCMQNLELLDLSGNSAMEVLPNLSGTNGLKVLILDDCDGLLHVEPDAVPTSLESFSFDGFGRASKWKNSLQIPEKKLRPVACDKEELPKVSKISLEGRTRLKHVFLQGLPNLEELNLSETGIKELDLEAMQAKKLERLFLVGCENLRRVQWLDARNPPLKLLSVDTRGKAERSMDGDCHRSHSYSQHDFVQVVATDARFLRGFGVFGTNFHLHLSSTVNSRQLPGTKEAGISSGVELGLVPAVGSTFLYSDVLDKAVKEYDNAEDCSLQVCTQLLPSERHIEFAEGGCNWEFKSGREGMVSLLDSAQSLHVHDNSSITAANLEFDYAVQFRDLRWCCVEWCPKLHSGFLLDSKYMSESSFESLQTFWASHLLAARYIWSKRLSFHIYVRDTAPAAFSQLRHIHLHSCPRLTLW
ncbi:uncharacterized protein LOC104583537 isoform X2 [Brachypodium distachyon]|uniref:NB-ARC domain-containing protein n=1 Tax=Brachypodium distachyon TaxID=15368 RepID=A0A0Q3I357_BRADI|nr:uncharacterized protein LOC104583537 isoform X2 [Brachypodium distachyon]XP_024318349.1 uncharacterized protein LOC104583537 isoform X2 [Brachypodium distachyon]XP_024318350.1 uncharacterized protein LOC104583537 isoform X2 [Brachypodium distachyon]XP_024318351.1 uncharacterized protein LOC104583537 isoform X2 [Brachypodium distachyon]XP_024318352.1 uncharacterized protein LOC104583537 isoform X2 [Brachypodium distachyon]XP_024318353.1 uncharacterized protein LOC104583537 isoform X2 [Brachy|eukprot:XP_024318348.1 uncharacterized protein LOC104583537 isoform X2 [Brachypodium distachyon]